MAISDLPGYIQGYVFSDDAAYYDSASKFFIDQGGFSDLPASRAEVKVGTPNFVNVGSTPERGIELDNSFHIYFNLPIAYKGSCIIVYGAPGFVASGTENFMIVKCNGVLNNFAGVPRIYMQHFSGQFRRYVSLASSTSLAYIDPGDSGVYAMTHVLDPDIGTKRVQTMDSGGVISNGATVSDNNVGLFLAGGTQGYEVPGTTTYRQIIGNLDGNPGSTAPMASGNTITLCEIHFFSGYLTDAPTTNVQTEMTALESKYA